MKIKTITAVAFVVASTGLSFGYTTSVANLNSAAPSELPIIDNAGTVIAVGSGSVGAGFFGTLADATLQITDFGPLVTDFQLFSGAVKPLNNGFNAPGFFGLDFDAPIPAAGNSFTDKSVYVMIGNGATLAGSSQLAVYKTTAQFGKENDLGLGSVSAFVGGGELLVGSSGGSVNVLAIDFADSIRLAAGPIPEPSVTLLGGLAGLALIIRRKR